MARVPGMINNGYATNSSNDEFLNTLFGGDVKAQYHALAQAGTSSWRQAAQLTQRIIAANVSQPEEKQAPLMLIYQQAATELGQAEVTVRGWTADEEIFADLIDEFPGVITRTHLRDIRSEARKRKADPRDVFLEWAGQAALYGVMKPHDLFAAEHRNGKATVPPMQRAAGAATKNLSTLLKHVSSKVYATDEPSERRKWAALQREVNELAKAAERVASRLQILLGEA